MALFPGSGKNKQVDTFNAGELEAASFKINQLEQTLRELTLTVDALWYLLKEQLRLDDNALSDRIAAAKADIESRSKETTTCSSCKRMVPASKDACYYCGAKLTF